MNIYNVTKNHPETREKIDEWTEISDINQTFDGVVFTLEEYLLVEAHYVEAIQQMMKFLGVKALTVSYLERRDYAYRPSLKSAFNTLYPIRMRELRKKVKPGQVLSRDKIPNMLRLMLRNALYAELEYKVNGSDEEYSFKVFIGFDYMMGVHSAKDISSLRDELLRLNMYLEG